jgi:hypothetical protein
MEIDDTGERKRLIETQRAASVFGRWSTVAAAFVLAGVAILIGVWLRRNA